MEGDQNTKFFHTVATHRKKTNRINFLDINGQQNSNPTDIKAHITQYYKSILGEPGLKFASMDPHFWDNVERVNDFDNSMLAQQFSEEEIKTALFASEPHGASGLDGFTFFFLSTLLGPSQT